MVYRLYISTMKTVHIVAAVTEGHIPAFLLTDFTQKLVISTGPNAYDHYRLNTLQLEGLSGRKHGTE